MTNTSKSVYSFEGEVLSEEDDEYNSDSSFGNNCNKPDNKLRINEDEKEEDHKIRNLGIDEQDDDMVDDVDDIEDDECDPMFEDD